MAGSHQEWQTKESLAPQTLITVRAERSAPNQFEQNQQKSPQHLKEEAKTGEGEEKLISARISMANWTICQYVLQTLSHACGISTQNVSA